MKTLKTAVFLCLSVSLIALAGCMTGVDDDGQMALLKHHRYNGEVKRVATVLHKGAHPAFAQNNMGIAPGHDIFGSHEPFIECG